MKRFCLLVLPAFLLMGCVAVPYDQPYVTYPDTYAYEPAYVVPAPVYGPPVYVGPPVNFSFGLNYWHGGGRFHHHGFHGGGHGGWRR